jgi:hypothetical protein
MERQAHTNSAKTHARGFRRGLLTLLAFVYLFVGISHQVSCLDQAVASTLGIEKVSAPLQDGASYSEAMLCDHCPNCVPAVMPSPVTEAASGMLPGSTMAALDAFSASNHARLESPPPKNLT